MKVKNAIFICFSLIVSDAIKAPIKPRSELSGRNIKQAMDAMTEEEAENYLRKQVSKLEAVPWGRQFQYEAFVQNNAELAAKQKEAASRRWAWYKKQWPDRSSDFRQGSCVRFRQEDGNITIADNDPRFHTQGYCNVARASYYNSEIMSGLTNYARAATTSLDTMYSVLQEAYKSFPKDVIIRMDQFEDLVQDKPELPIKPHLKVKDGRKRGSSLWSDFEDDDDDWLGEFGGAFSRSGTKESEEEEKSKLDIYGPDLQIIPREWMNKYVFKTSVLSGLSGYINLIVSVLKSMRTYEILGESEPHPGFLEITDLQHRESTVIKMNDVARKLLRIKFDYSVKSRSSFYSNLQSLIVETDKYSVFAHNLLNKFGDRYAAKSTDYFPGYHQRTALAPKPTLALRNYYRTLKAGLKSLMTKLEQGSKPRPGFTLGASTLKLPLPVYPYALAHVIQTRERFDPFSRRNKGANVEFLKFEISKELVWRNLPDILRSYFEGQIELIKRSMTEQILPAYLGASANLFPLFARYDTPHPLKQFYKSDLYCYFDHNFGKPRMMQILQAAMPSLDEPNNKQSERSDWHLFDHMLFANPANEPLWVTVGATFDSWTLSSSKARSRFLLEGYLNFNGIHTAEQTTTFCDIDDLLSQELLPRLSQQGEKNKRIAPLIKIKTDQTADTAYYTRCLNLVPEGTHIFISGSEQPADRVPDKLSLLIDGIKRTFEADKMSIRPSFLQVPLDDPGFDDEDDDNFEDDESIEELLASLNKSSTQDGLRRARERDETFEGLTSRYGMDETEDADIDYDDDKSVPRLPPNEASRPTSKVVKAEPNVALRLNYYHTRCQGGKWQLPLVPITRSSFQNEIPPDLQQASDYT